MNAIFTPTLAEPAPAHYQLAPSDRQKILSLSPYSARQIKIEQQRQRFIQMNGTDGISNPTQKGA